MKIKELKQFLEKAMLATYAGGGPEVEPQRPGFRELEFKEGKWYYRDSYTGYFQSWGQEVVWYDNKPVWTSLYGGGIVETEHEGKEFAHERFEFLKKALSAKGEDFQPRGPKKLVDGDWTYECSWSGDITKFKGKEKISYKGKVVFTHDFIGGLVKGK